MWDRESRKCERAESVGEREQRAESRLREQRAERAEKIKVREELILFHIFNCFVFHFIFVSCFNQSQVNINLTEET